ncbi:uracil-DNA glycosylase [Pseudovibrio exalbescens]|uniref:uracil-DNA glycosylase n=1 Tax=Pseudovibrio exalbescens TaxID=197461 RepID=UPI0023659B47|nr:uracil-DNA glycosylase [Pseudovibrio exalbescens]MDD7910706.1 uracil-DNA glycosylase [Pseudovibrio exalbescens]
MGPLDLEPEWRNILAAEFEQPYFKKLAAFLEAEEAAGKTIYPPKHTRFAAFNATPFSKVKVVLVGQDPYHGPGQAHGLSFSVEKGVRFPPSLRNIFKELEADEGIPVPSHGCLQAWAEQGVLLLNTSLSVEEGKAGSHAKKGWETFTSAALNALAVQREGIAYLLWGAHAQKKAKMVDPTKNLVLKGAHPSPLSAYRGFFGSKPFSAINEYLKTESSSGIRWDVDHVTSTEDRH